MKHSSDQVQGYIDRGYHIAYIDDIVKNFGEKLMRVKCNDDDISKVRQSGYKLSSRFWVNLVLASTSHKNEDKIVVADLQEEDNKTVFSKII